ncbi:MAG: hypothetical protein WA634_13820 [Silvibacterium sp.]
MTPRAIFSLATIGVAALVVPPIVFAPLHAASNHDFGGVVSAVEQHYSVHAQRMPMMGFISFCAHVTTNGGVKGMRIAEFDHFAPAESPAVLEKLVSDTLGSEWQPFVTEREAGGELSLIFVRPEGSDMRMLIADYDHGELDIVRMELNADRIQHWMQDPENSARHHNNQGN